jgi:hypothetical protein
VCSRTTASASTRSARPAGCARTNRYWSRSTNSTSRSSISW